MGSGTKIKAAIKKYGLINFRKDILFDFNTENEMKLKEEELVNNLFLARKDVYNIVQGGSSRMEYCSKISF